jgi:hypothetical protein
MKEIPLRDRFCKTQIYWLDLESLAYRIEKFEWVEDVEYTPCRGFATIFRKSLTRMEFAAIYVDSNNLFFQIGKKRWDIGNPNIQIRWTTCISLIRRCFKIIEDKQLVFRHKYIARYFFHPLRWIDFTYDPLDAEQDDFFMWIGKSYEDEQWVNNIIRLWKNGILGETEEKLLDELSRKEESHSEFVQGLSKQLRIYAERGRQKRKVEIARKLEEMKKWKKYKEEMKNKRI